MNIPRPDIPLARLLRQAADELAAQPTPPLPAALLQPAPARPVALAAPAPQAPGRRGWAMPAGAAAGFALLAGATWLVLGPALPPTTNGPQRAAGLEGQFLPVVSTDRWLRLAGDGASPAWLMTAELPAERLAAYGLPYDPGRAGEAVRAELLLNPAGEVLALRVVNRPITSPKRP